MAEAGTRPARFPWLLAAVAAVAVIVALRASFAGMAFQWRSSSTFSYGVLIAPIAMFLVWRERQRLARLPASPAWLPVLLAVPVAAGWAVAALLDVNVVQHFGAVLLVILVIWAVIGTTIARAIWFPLAYLLLMVPFGEFLVPTLMQWTADFAVLAVSLSGVPVFQDGYVFSLPTVDFEVIKACSGIRFLMATLAAGTVFAWVAYQGWRKRLVFLLACFVVPVIGNLLRAYLVVMLVHLSDGRLAGAHVLYGTIFFGAILAGLFLVGARYADPAAPAGSGPGTTNGTEAGPGAPAAMVVPGALIVLLAFLVAVLPAELRHRGAAGSVVAAAELPAPPGWLSAGAPPDWRADVRGGAIEQSVRYQRPTPAGTVDAFIGWYDVAADRGGDLTDARNRPYVARDWRRAGLVEMPGFTDLVLRPAPAAAAPEGSTRIVWWWYAVNGVATSSRVQAKVAELAALARGGPVRQAYVVLSAPVDGSAADARRALRGFVPAFCRTAAVACPDLPGEAGAPDATRAALSPPD